MINPIRTLGKGIKASVQTVKDIRETKRIEKQRLCKVTFIEKNNMVKYFTGKLTANSDFVVVENLDRLFMVDKLYYDNKFRPMVFVSTMFHRTIPIDQLGILCPKLEKELITDKNIKTLNLNEFDNKKSFDFTNDAFTIMRTKAFEFLEEVPKRTIYFVFLVGLLLGLFLGSIFAIWMIR